MPKHLHLPKLERRPELDALRGLFLVWMTLTHLPTRFADFVNQPLGFVSSAEGFVFISALLVGRLYIRDLVQNPANVRARLWKRSLKIYGYHLLMLALAFTVVAGFAVHTHKAALTNLLTFYLAHPGEAILGSVLLLYCPPLLDILPMYVTFLFFTPVVLSAAVRWGWKWILAASGLVWLMAQYGLRDVVHAWVVQVTHLKIPLQESGAFNLFAWQGKVFDAEHKLLKNRISVLGFEAIIASVYTGPSWMDGKDCVVLDYSQTSMVAHWIRDEIRLVSPNFYLGKVYWAKDRLIDFCLQF